MPFHFESYMARRYLRGAEGKAEGRRFLRLITWIAVGGVAVGVAALILSLSIVRGFSGEIRDKLTGFAAHVQVQSMRDAPLDGADAIRAVLEQESVVHTVSAVVQEFILLRRSARDIDGVSIWGTDRLPAFVDSSLVEGTGEFALPLEQGRGETNGMVIGAELSRLLGVAVGDRLTAFSVQSSGGAMVQAPRIKPFVVTGIYETSLADFDELYVFAEIDTARELLDYDADQVTRFDVRVGEGIDYVQVADRLDEVLAFPAIARPITDIYRSLFAWVALQESIIPLIISIIVFVAAINIIGTLLMVILEKNREMGVLAGMGATARMRRRIFVRLGLLIGASGVILGEVFALTLAVLQQQFGIIPLPADAYYMSTAPVDLNFMDFGIVAVVTLVLCTAASWIPARYAGHVNPIHAIQLR